MHQFYKISRLCASIVSELIVSGWLQVDFIEAIDGSLWLLEVNPRWTAGMEVLRLSGCANMVELHMLACGLSTGVPPTSRSCETRCWAVKAIYYAPQGLDLQAQVLDEIIGDRAEANGNKLNQQQDVSVDFADIPCCDQSFDKGHPVLTIRVRLATASVGWSDAKTIMLSALQTSRDMLDRALLQRSHWL